MCYFLVCAFGGAFDGAISDADGRSLEILKWVVSITCQVRDIQKIQFQQEVWLRRPARLVVLIPCMSGSPGDGSARLRAVLAVILCCLSCSWTRSPTLYVPGAPAGVLPGRGTYMKIKCKIKIKLNRKLDEYPV